VGRVGGLLGYPMWRGRVLGYTLPTWGRGGIKRLNSVTRLNPSYYNKFPTLINHLINSKNPFQKWM